MHVHYLHFSPGEGGLAARSSVEISAPTHCNCECSFIIYNFLHAADIQSRFVIYLPTLFKNVTAFLRYNLHTPEGRHKLTHKLSLVGRNNGNAGGSRKSCGFFCAPRRSSAKVSKFIRATVLRKWNSNYMHYRNN